MGIAVPFQRRVPQSIFIYHPTFAGAYKCLQYAVTTSSRQRWQRLCCLAWDYGARFTNGSFLKWWYPKIDGILRENPTNMDDFLGSSPISGNPLHCVMLPGFKNGAPYCTVENIVGAFCSRSKSFLRCWSFKRRFSWRGWDMEEQGIVLFKIILQIDWFIKIFPKYEWTLMNLWWN